MAEEMSPYPACWRCNGTGSVEHINDLSGYVYEQGLPCPECAALTSPQPAKEPGAAGAGLMWSNIRTHLQNMVGGLEGQTYEMRSAIIDRAARDLEDAIAAAQRHPAPSRGGVAGDAALRDMLLECKRVIESGPVDDVLWAEGLCPETLCDKIERVLGTTDDTALAPLDAPPCAEPWGGEVIDDDGDLVPLDLHEARLADLAEEPASPPAPVAQAEEALGALAPEELDTIEDAARCAYSGEGVQHIDPQTVLRLIAAARASRAAGAEGA